MKTRLLTLALAALCSLVFAGNAAAQGCGVTAYYSNYLGWWVDATNHIYQSVTTSGYAQMSPTNYCHLTGVTHTPIATNTLKEPNGTVHGGTYTGSSGCPSCYISEQNTLVIVGVPGVVYFSDTGGSVRCSVVGTFWADAGNDVSLKLVVGTFGLQFQNSTSCEYFPTCTGTCTSNGRHSFPTAWPPTNVCPSYLFCVDLYVIPLWPLPNFCAGGICISTGFNIGLCS